MSDLSEQEKSRMEANKMFDIAEKPMMEYMCYFYKKTPEELFSNYENVVSDNLIIFPLEVDSHFISLSIEMVDKDYISVIPENVKKNDTINNSIGFLYNAISCVTNAISLSNIKDEYKEEVDKNFIHFAFDEDDWSFRPVYVFWKRRKYMMTQDLLARISKTLEKLEQNLDQEECRNQYDELKQYYEHNQKLFEEYHYDDKEAKQIELQKNEELKSMNKIGIKYTELKFEDLNEQYKNIIKEKYPHLYPKLEKIEELDEIIVVED